MAIEGKVVPPNTIDDIVENNKPTLDFSGFMVNLSKTITISGSGSPEGVVEAPKRTLYMDEDAVASPGTFFYIKTTESSKTGWKLV